MLDEAIELLERNVQVGVRSAETYRRLARLYLAQGDEASSLAATVKASEDQWQPLVSEPPLAVEVQAEPTQPWMLRHLTSYFLMMIGLGITIGAAGWILTRF